MQGFSKIKMVLLAHYDLELHQMNIKTVFLNGDLYKNVYMAQPKGFIVEEKNVWDAACRNPFMC